MDETARVYLVQIAWQVWTSANSIEVSVGLKGGALPNFATEIQTDSNSKTIFVCDPPTFAQYVRIEMKKDRLQLCEADVYATGNPYINRLPDI